MIIGNLEDEHGDEFLANLLEASSNINISKWLINIDEILVSEKWIPLLFNKFSGWSW
jgi:adenine-specific DNA methylase